MPRGAGPWPQTHRTLHVPCADAPHLHVLWAGVKIGDKIFAIDGASVGECNCTCAVHPVFNAIGRIDAS